MALVDTEGRLFGRVNLIDAAIGGFIVLLIPLAIGAALLFRAPTPIITSVEQAPVTMTEDRAAQGSPLSGKLKVRGTGLRPVLRAEIGGRPAIAFVFESPSSADVLYGDLPAGTHDLILFDGVQEVARSPRALTVQEKFITPSTRMRAVGTFMDMPDAAARELQRGAKFPTEKEPQVEILAIADPQPARYPVNNNTDVAVPERWQVGALAAVRCEVVPLEPRECRLAGKLVSAGSLLIVPGTAGNFRFFVDEALPDVDPIAAEMRVRFVGYAGVLEQMHAGDRDRTQWDLDGRGAVIASLSAPQRTTGAVAIGIAQEASNIAGQMQANESVVTIDASIRLGLDASRTAWRYRNDLVRAGGPITFITNAYIARGVVLSITPSRPPEVPAR